MAKWARRLLLLAGVGLAAPVSAVDRTDQLSHVRTSEPAVQALLDWGLTRSATLASLVETMDRSDVIVHVQEVLVLVGVKGRTLAEGRYARSERRPHPSLSAGHVCVNRHIKKAKRRSARPDELRAVA